VSQGSALLKLSGLNIHYGVFHALVDLDLVVHQGEIVTLIGANGAGKTTPLRGISGLISPTSGRIEFRGEEISRRPPHLIVRDGISHSPEGSRRFPQLSVSDNLELGAYTRRSSSDIDQDRNHIFELFPILQERRLQPAGTLPGGEQQMLAIGRALMSRPAVLLLDEPSLGLAPFLVQEIFRIVQEINRAGTTVLLVEQNARQELKVAHRGYVLETGRVTLSDSAEALLANEGVRKAYLGE